MDLLPKIACAKKGGGVLLERGGLITKTDFQTGGGGLVGEVSYKSFYGMSISQLQFASQNFNGGLKEVPVSTLSGTSQKYNFRLYIDILICYL